MSKIENVKCIYSYIYSYNIPIDKIIFSCK